MIDAAVETTHVYVLGREGRLDDRPGGDQDWLESIAGRDVVAVASCDQMLELVAKGQVRRPGCLLVDYELVGDGFQRIQAALLQAKCSLPMILVAKQIGIEAVVHAFEHGAWTVMVQPQRPGAESKDSLGDHVQQAIEWDRFQVEVESEHTRRSAILKGLTERQRKVLDCVMDGMPTKAIAASHKVSKRLIEFERSHLLSAFGVAGTAELTAVVGEHRTVERFLDSQSRAEMPVEGRAFRRPSLLRGHVSSAAACLDD
ncbi:response regulator transcription factor [Rhodopirellula halodulae]|uniref:response regulator transcription factor n=1 Tax=Rhodopirellula halodulae TaxID=2894198 RepID=UPI001E3EF16E|nr:LuxR C-terminal-related transcriptional regulator [Rhodopirellula sp. JC737]MCC9657909.1 LuxR C-terminal-related transcriptional regulator [Rhodopirellula sp. JC737]